MTEEIQGDVPEPEPSPSRPELAVEPVAAEQIRRGEHTDPHVLLGPHPIPGRGLPGVVVRAFHPDAVRAECLVPRRDPLPMEPLGGGLFAVLLPRRKRVPRYHLRFGFADGNHWEHEDPYRFATTIETGDLERLASGEHDRLYEVLGAHPMTVDGVAGTRFAVWAPNARSVRAVGEFCAWDGRLLPMRSIGRGVWELFVPRVRAGTRYGFEVLTRERQIRHKADPLALATTCEPDKETSQPNKESQVADLGARFVWRDGAWMRRRAATELRNEPMSVYEVHLGSWDRDREGGFLGYRELAPRLVAHAQRFGFTHLELLPIAEHAYYPSWGYQVTSFFAPTQRYGSADDLRWFVDHCHGAGIGVIVDWVPAHFPQDDWALRRFDGPPLYEDPDPELGEHPEWGTLVFDFARPEVRSFLVSNAMYWLREFHFDGLRVDAVSWIVYRDYLRASGRARGAWEPSEAGRSLLAAVNEAVALQAPGAVTIAEEATALRGVTAPVGEGGLGFTFKWNMGWMSDTLKYFRLQPAQRALQQDLLTFGMHYEHDECFVNPLSHDEVVHCKDSLLQKMAGGSEREKFANLRLLLTYQFTRPGKKLLFMGTELGPEEEWDHDRALEWAREHASPGREWALFVQELGALYRRARPLWRRDPDPDTFAWIDGTDRQNSVISFVRRDGDDHLVVILNLGSAAHDEYRVGVPGLGKYSVELSTDAPRYGGRGLSVSSPMESEEIEFLGWAQSVVVSLAPVSALVLSPADGMSVQEPPEGAVMSRRD